MWAISIGRPDPGHAFVYVSWKSSLTCKSTVQLFKDCTVRASGVATTRKLQMTLWRTISQSKPESDFLLQRHAMTLSDASLKQL